jgi:hypothetical protein
VQRSRLVDVFFGEVGPILVDEPALLDAIATDLDVGCIGIGPLRLRGSQLRQVQSAVGIPPGEHQGPRQPDRTNAQLVAEQRERRVPDLDFVGAKDRPAAAVSEANVVECDARQYRTRQAVDLQIAGDRCIRPSGDLVEYVRLRSRGLEDQKGGRNEQHEPQDGPRGESARGA